MWAKMVWNESWMWGRTGSRTSSSGQFSSAVRGMTRETDLPAWTMRICLSNIRWNGKTWQKICGETSGSAATSSKSSGWSRSNSLALFGVFGVFGVARPTSVMRNWTWSATFCSCLCWFRIAPFPWWKWSLCGQLVKSSFSPKVVTSLAKNADGWNYFVRIYDVRANHEKVFASQIWVIHDRLEFNLLAFWVRVCSSKFSRNWNWICAEFN